MPGTMRAVVLRNGQAGLVRDYPCPQPGLEEALVRVSLAGICATDLEIVKGYAGFEGVLGHEFVGLVEEAPDPSWLAQRVVGSINLGCGVCDVCVASGPEHCPQRTVLGIHERDGAFADYLTLPVSNLHRVPDDIADEEAVFTEPLAASARILQQVPVPPESQVAVVGPGRMGMLIAQVLNLTGAKVTVLGRTASSLQLAQQMGLQTHLVDDCAGDTFDLVVEATGNDAGLAHSLRLVRPLGTLLMKSTFHGKAQVDLTKLVVGEITVVGSRCGPFDEALRLLQQGSVEVRPLIDADYALDDALAGLKHAARPGVRKVLLRP